MTPLNPFHSSSFIPSPLSSFFPLFPDRQPGTSSAASDSATTLHSRLLGFVRARASTFVRRRGPSPLRDDVTFTADVTDDFVIWQQLRQAAAYEYSQPTAALPLVADRVSLPSNSGSVDLLSVLPNELVSFYERESPALVTPVERRAAAPRAVLCASDGDYAHLIHRMHSIGMVDFTLSPAVVNGVFAVPKGDDAQRLIIDARPANAAFCEPPEIKLPTPDLLSDLIVDPSRPLYVAKIDIDNYYHRLKLPVWMRRYFALPSVRAGDVHPALAAKYGPETRIFPCCTTLPMGWSHSVFLAQRAHEHLANTRTPLRPSDRITEENDRTIDRCRHLIYIDDVNLFSYDRDELRRVQSEYEAIMNDIGLHVKPTKVVAPTCYGVDCLGLLVHGVDHTISLSPVKLQKLIDDTTSLLLDGTATGESMARIVGRWTWATLVRRPALSIFSAVYRFIECASAVTSVAPATKRRRRPRASRTFDIWKTCERELQIMIALAPLLVQDLSALWFERVTATDACETGQGLVAVRMDEAGVHDTARLNKDELNDFVGQLSAAGDWRTIVAAPWRDRSEHINVLELRAALTAVRWALSFPTSVNHRLLILSDSQVVVGAANKGRSSSRPLLRRLRALAALVLASGVRVTLRWVPSEVNPADGPSRRFQT